MQEAQVAHHQSRRGPLSLVVLNGAHSCHRRTRLGCRVDENLNGILPFVLYMVFRLA